MDDKFKNTKISKSGYWFEKIDLTELQIEKLEALQKLVTEAGERGEKAMLLAQVFPSVAALSVGFLPHEEAYRVLEIINPQGYQKAVEAGEIPAKLDNLLPRAEVENVALVKRAEAAEAENTRLTAELAAANDFHPRAMKLIKKRKPFLVVASDESYYRQVYDLIRDHEMLMGTWTTSDQWRYEDALTALKGGE